MTPLAVNPRAAMTKWTVRDNNKGLKTLGKPSESQTNPPYSCVRLCRATAYFGGRRTLGVAACHVLASVPSAWDES